MRVVCTTIVVLACVGHWNVVAAQDVDVPSRLTLAVALEIARQRNPELAAARTEVDIATADGRTASIRPNPAFTFASDGYPLGDTTGASFMNKQQTTWRVDQEIELAGRRSHRQTAASAAVAGARSHASDQQRLLELEVRRAYMQAVLAKADRDVATSTLEEIDRVIALNRARFQNGEVSGSDVRRLQVERLKFVEDVFAAELALKNARSALLARLNAPDLGLIVDPVDTLASSRQAAAALRPVTAVDVNVLVSQALATRPDAVAARQNQQRADTETSLQRALRTPNLTVGGGYTRDHDTNAIAFGVTLPLPLFNRNTGGVTRAEAEARQAGQLTEAVTIAVRLDVQQAVNALETNRARVDYIEREYLGAAAESRDIVLAAYRLGTADLIDYLDAQRAYRDTVRTYNRALYDDLTSTYLLQAALGHVGGTF